MNGRVRSGEDIVTGYRAIALLRRGDDVDVYDAWSTDRDCRCVVKTVRGDRSADRGARRRLLDEGRRLLGLSHPQLVRAYEVIERPRPAVVLETLSGDTLGALIGTHGPRLPLAEVCALGIQLCSGVGYLHRHGLLHLDLKPSNVVCHLDQAKLLDLGIARPPGRGPKGVGSPPYMAPEQFRGGVLTTATDVWGIGAVLYEATTRQLPFGPAGAVLPGAAPSVASHRRLPRRFAAAVDACLSADATHRPSLADLTRTLRGLLPHS